jgi:hypothetical protein
MAEEEALAGILAVSRRQSTGRMADGSSKVGACSAGAMEDTDDLDLVAGYREQDPIATMPPPIDQLPDLRPCGSGIENLGAPLWMLARGLQARHEPFVQRSAATGERSFSQL